MIIFWSCNVLPSSIAELLGKKKSFSGGWLDMLCSHVINDKSNSFFILVPGNRKTKHIRKTVIAENITSYEANMQMNIERLKMMIYDILKEVKPEIIHQFGTELITSVALTRAVSLAGMKDRFIVSVQGVTGYIARQYSRLIPPKYLRLHTLLGFLKEQDLCDRINHLIKMSKVEGYILNNARYILGRTDLDFSFCRYYGADNKYIKCGETLRDEFYTGEWNFDKVEEGSIFSSTNSGAVKGLHILLDALSKVVLRHPEVHLYVTGKNILKTPRWKLNSYELFILKKIKKLHLEERVTFLGLIPAQEMKERILKSNVVVVSSVAENSSNFLGESMLLGAPCVASDVGGNKEFLENGVEGYCYQYDSPELLAYYIESVIEKGETIKEIASRGSAHAKENYALSNFLVVLNLYKRIVENGNK